MTPTEFYSVLTSHHGSVMELIFIVKDLLYIDSLYFFRNEFTKFMATRLSVANDLSFLLIMVSIILFFLAILSVASLQFPFTVESI